MRAVELLIRASRDKDETIRKEVNNCLFELKAPEGLPVILRMAIHEKDSRDLKVTAQQNLVRLCEQTFRDGDVSVQQFWVEACRNYALEQSCRDKLLKHMVSLHAGRSIDESVRSELATICETQPHHFSDAAVKTLLAPDKATKNLQARVGSGSPDAIRMLTERICRGEDDDYVTTLKNPKVLDAVLEIGNSGRISQRIRVARILKSFLDSSGSDSPRLKQWLDGLPDHYLGGKYSGSIFEQCKYLKPAGRSDVCSYFEMRTERSPRRNR